MAEFTHSFSPSLQKVIVTVLYHGLAKNAPPVGVILWFDDVPGIQYCISMDPEADYTVLWFFVEQLLKCILFKFQIICYYGP